MKLISIENEGITSPTIFINHDSSLEKVLCAFDADAVCSPNCAACNVIGTKAYCNRGIKDDFCIGLIKEE